MPTVNKRDWPHLYVSTMCPLCVEGGFWPITVWFGSCDDYLFSFNKTSGDWEHIGETFFADDTIFDMVLTKDGTLWVTSGLGGLYSFDGVTWTTHAADSTPPYTSGPVAANFPYLCPDAVGGLWVSYGDSFPGVSHYDGTNWVYYTDGDLATGHIRAMFLSPNTGYVWFLNYTNSTLLPHTGSAWGTAVSLPYTAIDDNSLYITNSGVIWVGQSSNVSKYDGETWTNYISGSLGLQPNIYSAIYANDDGEAWVGSLSYLVQYFDGTSWSDITPDGLSSTVAALNFDSEGALWVNTWYDGVWKYEDGVWTNYNNSNSGFNSYSNNAYSQHIVMTTNETPERLARDPQAWREHLIRCHGAPGGMSASHWGNVGQYGDDEGRRDTKRGHLHRFPYKCYACGQSFATNALLVTHINAVHLT